MADAVGARNIWDCIGRLQSNGPAVGDPTTTTKTHESSQSRSSINDEVGGQISKNSVDNTYSQPLHLDGNCSNTRVSQSCKSKKRGSVSLFASMQKKLKISHLNLQQKPAEMEVAKGSTELECPLDLSIKSDDVASTGIVSPLDLSFKKEFNSPSSCTSLLINSTDGPKTEENVSLISCVSDHVSLLNISKQFVSLQSTPKKVSSVRPHIGGKPVVMDSNGNIPLNSFIASDAKKVSFFDALSKEYMDKSTLSDSNENFSIVHSFGSSQARVKTCCAFSDLPVETHKESALINSVKELEQQSSRGSVSRIPVMEMCGNDLSYSNDAPGIASSSSLGNTAPVPDLVISALGLDQCNDADSLSEFTNENCLRVPVFKCQKKSKLTAKKTSKTTHNIGDVQKRKSVPLAKVRPSRLVSPEKTTESVKISDTLDSLKSASDLVSSTKSVAKEVTSTVELIKELSPTNETGQIIDSSGSPPVLSLLSPMSKTSVTPNDNVLLSPPMPILSPRVQSFVPSPSDLCRAFARRVTSTPINSFGDSESGVETRHSEPDLQNQSYITVCDDSIEISSQDSSIEASVLPSGESLAQSLDLSGFRKQIIDASEEDIFADAAECRNDVQTMINNCSKRNSGGINAFLVNSNFGKEVFKKSKLLFYASLAFDHEANASANVRPNKDFILNTKYYKVIAPKFGFSFNCNKDTSETDAQQRNVTESLSETNVGCRSQRVTKGAKCKSPEKSSAVVKDTAFGRLRQQSGSRLVRRRKKDCEVDTNCVLLSSDNLGNTTRSPAPLIAGDIHRISRSASRKSLREEPYYECDTLATQTAVSRPSNADTRTENICEVSPTAKQSSIVHALCNGKENNKLSVSHLNSTDRTDELKFACKRVACKALSVSPPKKAKCNNVNDKSLNDCGKLDMETSKTEVSDSSQSLPAFEVKLPSKEKEKLNLVCKEKEKLNLVCKEKEKLNLVCKEKEKLNLVCKEKEKLNLVCKEKEKLNLVCKEKEKLNLVCKEKEKLNLVSKEIEKQSSHRPRNDAVLPTGSTSLNNIETTSNQVDGRELIVSTSPIMISDVKSKKAKIAVSLSPSKPAVQPCVRGSKKDDLPRRTCEPERIQSPVTKNVRQNDANESYRKNSKLVSGHQSSSLLRELANSDGYVAEKHTPKRNDNLFIDSRFLSREERALQMALMRMTKMEVKEEWSKVKDKQSNASQKKRKVEDLNKGKPLMHECEKEEIFAQSESKIMRPKEKMEVDRKLKNKASTLMQKGKKKVTEVVKKVKKLELDESFGSPKSVNTNKPVKHKAGLSWVNNSVRNHTRKPGRFRCRWKSGIWKKPKHSPSPNSSRSLKAKLSSRKNVYHSLMVDVGTLVSPMVSLSPCISTGSKLSPFFEKIHSKDDDVVSLSSSLAEYGVNRRTLPAEVKKLVTCHATGETVLHRAARLGYTDVALWCCQANYVDVDAKDFAGYTPLHETFLHSNIAIARYLIHYGADLNNAAERRGGSRPLHEAVESDSVEMVRMLLSAGADINLTNYSGKTVKDVIHTAKMKEFLEAYLNDINGGSEVEWNFRPSWDADDDPAGLGSDLLTDVPCDEDLNCQSVSFEESETPFLPTYNLKIHKEDMPRSRVLLCDILERLQMTKEQFLLQCPSVTLETLPWEYLCAQFASMQSVNEQLLSEIKAKCSGSYVDVFCPPLQLKELLKVVSNISLEYSCKGHLTEEKKDSKRNGYGVV